MFRSDFLIAARSLRRDPLFVAVAILTLGLGISAATVVFSLVYSVLLRPLPFDQPDRIVLLEAHKEGGSIGVAYPDFLEWRRQIPLLESVAAASLESFNLFTRQQPQRAQGGRVTASWFALLGTKPLLGRVFAAEEELYGRHRVAVLSHSLWVSRFASDPSIVGQPLRLNGEPYQITGVMPPSFADPVFAGAELWVPLSFPAGDQYTTRGNYFLTVLARLRPDVSVSQAHQELAAVNQKIYENLNINLALTTQVAGLHASRTAPVRRTLWVLLLAIFLVVVIACANIANLLLLRASRRSRDLAIRVALGAAQSRLLVPALAESVLLSLAGGATGLLLAFFGLAWVKRFAPAGVPRLQDATLDAPVIVGCFALTAAVALLCGILPALRGARTSALHALQDAARGSGGRSRSRLRSILVVAQVALSLLLLTGAGLLMRSLSSLLAADPGFRPDGVLTCLLPLPETRYGEPERGRQFASTLLERLHNIPGVSSAGFTTALPLSGAGWGKFFWPLDRATPTSLDQVPVVQYRQVSAGYFAALGIRLRQGRLFTSDDRPESVPVAVINQALARTIWPGADPIGKTVQFLPPGPLIPAGILPPGFKAPITRIIGVIDDIRTDRLDQPASPEVFVPQAQSVTDFYRTFFVALRTPGDPSALASAVRAAVAQVDAEQPVASLMPMTRRVGDALSQPRFRTWLLTGFAAFALLLAALGLYGVISYSVASRTREIGIRMALGARASQIATEVVAQGAAVMGFGLLAGMALSFVTARSLSALLYGVRPNDAVAFLGAAFVLALVAIAGCLIPAVRAARIQPARALHYE